jgi:hypothetical protein
MVAPLTPKPTRKAEALAKAPQTIASRREEDVAMNEVSWQHKKKAGKLTLFFRKENKPLPTSLAS